MRGFSGLQAALDCEISVTRDGANNIVATVLEMKDDESGAAVVSKLSKPIEIGKDKKGRLKFGCIVEPIDGPPIPKPSTARGGDDHEQIKQWLLEAYDRLADGVKPSRGLDGSSTVKKVKKDDIRDAMNERGFLESENGTITTTGRNHFRRARLALIKARIIIEDKGLIWRKYAKVALSRCMKRCTQRRAFFFALHVAHPL
jgi:hypothetical protein